MAVVMMLLLTLLNLLWQMNRFYRRSDNPHHAPALIPELALALALDLALAPELALALDLALAPLR